jgi:hypothetical protein
MQTEKYRGFVIDVRTSDLGDDRGWRALVNIERHLEDTIVSPTESLPEVYKSESEAREAGSKFGRTMIDKKLG